jgi:uncharacterized protein YifE (UPF0438 family)
MDDTFYLRYTAEEKELLAKHLQFYVALDSGQKVPDTEKQRHFVQFCRGKDKAITPHEFAYLKYKRIQSYRNKLKLKSTTSNNLKLKSKKETKQTYNFKSSRPSQRLRRSKFSKNNSDYNVSAASVRARNCEMLKNQEVAIKLQALKRSNVRNAMVIHSDPND